MDLFNRRELKVRRSHQTAVWTFTDEGLGESVADIYVQAPGEIYYLRQRFIGELPDPSMLYYGAYKSGLRSPRPLHLSSVPDASSFYCALALSVSCCKAWGLDAVGLMMEADRDARVSESDLLEIKQHARWERVAFPGTWHTDSIGALCQVLNAVECAALAKLIDERTVRARGY